MRAGFAVALLLLALLVALGLAVLAVSQPQHAPTPTNYQLPTI